MGGQYTRRDVLRLGAMGAGAVLAGACAPAAAPSPSAAPATAAAAATAAATPAKLSLVHEAGTTVLPKTASKLAILQWQFAEALLQLDVKPAVIADERSANGPAFFPDHLRDRFGGYASVGSRISPNLEVLASTPVDLIFADRNEHQKNYETLTKIAPTVLHDTNSYPKLFSNFEQIAQAVGKEGKAKEVRAALEQDIAKAKAKAQGKAGPRTIAAVLTPDRFFVYFADALPAAVLQDLGASYAYKADPSKPTEAIGLEALPALDPEVIVGFAFNGEPNVLRTWKDNAIWKGLRAVKSDRIYLLNRHLILGRGVMSVRQIVDQLTPALYPA